MLDLYLKAILVYFIIYSVVQGIIALIEEENRKKFPPPSPDAIDWYN